MACGAMPGPPGCIIFSSSFCFVIESEIAERERERERERNVCCGKCCVCVCGLIYKEWLILKP
jgi:hypothetical protein